MADKIPQYIEGVGWRYETEHNHLQRMSNHDYTLRCIYMLTLTLDDRSKPLLGTLRWAEGSAEPQGVCVPSALGEAVAGEWAQLEDEYPQLEVMALQLMPEHLHVAVFVHYTLPLPLGSIVGKIKNRCNKHYWRLLTAAGQLGPKGEAKPPALFSEGFQDTILAHKGQLDYMLAYIRSNPKRALIKRERPELFQVVHELVVPLRPLSDTSGAAKRPRTRHPEAPAQQRQPEALGQPEAPAQQRQPEAPAQQRQPEALGQPEAPAQQRQPEALGQPEAPAQQRQPEALGQQRQPEAPAQQGHPEAPAQQGHPEAPAQQGQPEALGLQGQPEALGQHGQPEARALQALALVGRPFEEVTFEAARQLRFAAIGNRWLLERPVRLQIRCHNNSTPENLQLIERQREYILARAAKGGVVVSPCISPGEKAIARAALDAGLPLIVVLENGFKPYYKPPGKYFEACAKGLLLMLAPWPYHEERRAITRQQCLELNAITSAIATEPWTPELERSLQP